MYVIKRNMYIVNQSLKMILLEIEIVCYKSCWLIKMCSRDLASRVICMYLSASFAFDNGGLKQGNSFPKCFCRNRWTAALR